MRSYQKVQNARCPKLKFIPGSGYYFCGERVPDIGRYRFSEKQNSATRRLYQWQTSPSRRLSRQASTSIHVISPAPPLLEYLNILSSRSPLSGGLPPPRDTAAPLSPPPCTLLAITRRLHRLIYIHQGHSYQL